MAKIRRLKKLTYRSGTFFKAFGDDELYILAQIDKGVHKLIGLHSGNRFMDDPVTDDFIRRRKFTKEDVAIEI